MRQLNIIREALKAWPSESTESRLHSTHLSHPSKGLVVGLVFTDWCINFELEFLSPIASSIDSMQTLSLSKLWIFTLTIFLFQKFKEAMHFLDVWLHFIPGPQALALQEALDFSRRTSNLQPTDTWTAAELRCFGLRMLATHGLEAVDWSEGEMEDWWKWSIKTFGFSYIYIHC